MICFTPFYSKGRWIINFGGVSISNEIVGVCNNMQIDVACSRGP